MQADTLNIPNSDGLTYRLAVNEALKANATDHAGTTAPVETWPRMVWLDTSTTPATLRRRNEADDAWEVPAILADNIFERTTGHGVEIDGVLLKDGLVNGVDVTNISGGVDPDTLTDATLAGSERVAIKQAGSWFRATMSNIAAFVTGIYTVTLRSGPLAAARTLAAWLQEKPVSITDFGADKTGAADSTAAIQAAAAFSARIHGPAGTYLFSTLTFTQPISLHGDGAHLTIFKTNTTTGNVITFNAGANLVTGTALRDFQIVSLSPRTSGFSIAFQSTTGGFFRTSIRDLILDINTYSGISLTGSMFYTWIIDTDIEHVGTNGVGVFAEGRSRVGSEIIGETKLLNVNVNSGPDDGTGIGFHFRDKVDGIYATKCQAAGSIGYGLSVGRLSGGDAIPPRDHWYTNCVFDYPKVIGAYLLAGWNLNFTSCWTSSSRGTGIDVGNVIGCNIANHTAIGNELYGVVIGAGSDAVHVMNSLICGSGGAVSNSYTDIQVKGGASNFQIGWNRFQRAGQTNTAYANIYVEVGASDNYIIAYNTAKSGMTYNIFDAGTGSNKIVANNLI